MKKNILLKSLTTFAALTSIVSVSTLAVLTSCSKTAKIVIKNKVNTFDWTDGPYKINVDFENSDGASIIYSSSNKNVAEIDQQGFIYAQNPGKTTIRACSSKNQDIADQFELTINATTITGVVKDTESNLLSNVIVSSNGKVVKTDANGKYSIGLASPNDVIYYEKEGYISEVFGCYSEIAYNQHQVNIILTPYDKGKDVSITGTINDWSSTLVKHCSITFNPNSVLYKRHTITDENGKFTIVARVSKIPTTIAYTVNNANYDASEKTIEITSETVSDLSIRVAPNQRDITVFKGTANSSQKIFMHAYRKYALEDKSGMLISFQSNFICFDNKDNKYTLTFDCEQEKISNPNAGLGTKDFSLTYTIDGINEAKGEVIKGKDLSLIKLRKIDNWNLTIFIDDQFYNFSTNDTIGIHLNTYGRGIFNPYNHEKYNTNDTNHLCYIRLDENNALFSASDNKNPFDGLNWETKSDNVHWYVTNPLGFVGSKYNFGYQIKIAKNIANDGKEGLYILTKFAQDQMADFIPDDYCPHFFFDPIQLEDFKYPTRAVDKNIKNFCPISGYWLQQHQVKDFQHASETIKQYNEFFDGSAINNSPKIYSNKELMITYIPYSFLKPETGDFTADSTFGFACNLYFRYTGSDWHAWQGQNPSGYGEIPHFENLTSYIQFDKYLSIIPYS